MTNQPHTCARCGCQVPKPELHIFGGQVLCSHCLEEDTLLHIANANYEDSDEDEDHLTAPTAISAISAMRPSMTTITNRGPSSTERGRGFLA